MTWTRAHLLIPASLLLSVVFATPSEGNQASREGEASQQEAKVQQERQEALAVEVEANGYTAGVSPSRAEVNIALQHRGTKVDIVDQVREELDRAYGGIWFDNQTSQFVVSLSTGGRTQAETARHKVDLYTEFAAASLAGSYRVELVRYSHEELLAAQMSLDQELEPYFDAGLVETALDSSENAIELRVPLKIDVFAEAGIRRAAGAAEVPVVVHRRPNETFEKRPAACIQQYRKCDLPLRGGVILYQTYSPDPWDLATSACTAAFRANGLDGRKYVLTAGHCTLDEHNNRIWNFMTQDTAGGSHNIGTVSQWHWPGKDWAKVDATGAWPDSPPWPTLVAFWQKNDPYLPANYEYPITGEAKSYKGQTLCHVGANSGTSCGEVIAENVSVEYVDGEKVNGLFEATGPKLCLGSGDSGGPFFASNVALGILSGGVPDGCPSWIVFSDIMAANAELSVNIAGIGAPEAITGTATNVSVNQATVSGQVNPHGLATSYTFEYGIGGYSKSSTSTNAGSGKNFTSVSATLSGLQPGSTYQYRLKATNALNTAYGSQGTFTTKQRALPGEDDDLGGAHAVTQVSGVIDAFFRTSSGGLGHNFYLPQNGWGSETLGGSVAAGAAPHPVMQSNGTQDVFYRTPSNGLGHNWYTPGSGWHLENLSGAVAGEPHGVVDYSGTMNVFWRTPTGGLGHAFYIPGSGQGWQLENLSGSLASDPHPVVDQSGTMNVFWRTPTGGLGHIYYVPGSGKGWQLENLAGSVSGSPHPVVDDSGTMNVFWRTPTGGLGHIYYVPGSGKGWQLENLAGSVASEPRPVVQVVSGAMDVFYRTPSGTLGHNWYTGPKGWNLENFSPTLTGEPFPIKEEGGAMNVFYRTPSGTLGHTWYTAQTGWGHDVLPGTVDANTRMGIHATAQNGVIDVFFRTPAGELGHDWYNGVWFGGVLPGSL